jgi:UDP-glucose 4-epimerase
MNILLTGGLGFIGSHTASVLLGRGFNPILLDNLCNSQPSTLDRLEQIAEKKLVFYDVDVRDKNAVHRVLKEQQIHAVMHFAGLKSVAESESEPLKYYDNNVTGTISLVQVMQEAGLRKTFLVQVQLYTAFLSICLTMRITQPCRLIPTGEQSFRLSIFCAILRNLIHPGP